jgi:gamma-glutamyltranspeptidase/glutathione hydrolase
MKFRKQIARTLVIALSYSHFGFAADLSPKKWKVEHKRRLETMGQTPWPVQGRVAEGQFGLISATTSPIAVHAGMEALKQGGTAADAAATVALTQVTTALGSYVSYAGILQLVYYDAKSGKVYSLNAGWNSYLNETDPKTIPVSDLGLMAFAQKPTVGPVPEGRKTLVPGFMAGIEAMHQRFGRVRFRELFQPAIWYAENGVTVSPLLATYFQMREKHLSRTQEGRQFIHQAGNHLPKAGDRFVQADLARTLRLVAKHGAKYMYTGAWGQQFVDAVRREGGKATLEDMKRYQPIWEEPLSTTFLGHTVLAPGASGEGGYQVLQALNLLEELKADQKGPYWKDPQAFRSLARVLQFVSLGQYAPRVLHPAGVNFSAKDRATKAYAKAIAPMLDALPGKTPTSDDPPHSDAIVVIDRWGNVAALGHTIYTAIWGTTGIVVGGIAIPDAGGFLQARLGAVKPGERIPNEEAPILVLKGAKPVLATAGIGSSLIPETVRLLLGMLGNRIDPQTLRAAPPLLLNFNFVPKAGETYMDRTQVVPEGAYDADFLKNLELSGMKVEQVSRRQVLETKGTVVMGMVDPETGTRRSIETAMVLGFAEAY